MHVIFAVVDVFDECQGCDERSGRCPGMLDACDENAAGVKALAVVPEDSCHADGLPRADGARHEGVVVVDVHESIVVMPVVGTGRGRILVFGPRTMQKDETAMILLMKQEEGEWCRLNICRLPN